MLRLCVSHYFGLEITAQLMGGPKIHFAAAQRVRQFLLPINELKITGSAPFLEHHKEVYVALRSEILAQIRPEDGQLADMVLSAKVLINSF